ncbi:hypothetical protein BJ944DRAFT_234694, partial [Cunninghamella echinulata]
SNYIIIFFEKKKKKKRIEARIKYIHKYKPDDHLLIKKKRLISIIPLTSHKSKFPRNLENPYLKINKNKNRTSLIQVFTHLLHLKIGYGIYKYIDKIDIIFFRKKKKRKEKDKRKKIIIIQINKTFLYLGSSCLLYRNVELKKKKKGLAKNPLWAK